jgi:hypothetical protein
VPPVHAAIKALGLDIGFEATTLYEYDGQL